MQSAAYIIQIVRKLTDAAVGGDEKE